ncbi:MAG TPA: hypothetical protein VGU71_18235 [Candidatus Dormibacteraeota bacterium]|nr:hypothetical protein [Candidatus Dormibacteraeota bacterium]
MKRLIRLLVVAAVAVGWQIAAPTAALAAETPERPASQTCDLGNGVQHVVNVVFDNTHFSRDNPNVPSDLEQMPHLLNFIKGQGTLLTNQHTPLIAHTATDILTALTGVYGDRMGVPVSNTFRYFNPSGTSNPGVSFAYWTSPIFDFSTSTPTDTTFNMLTAQGKNAPAPWVPFTRAGCNVGGVATANIELENTSIDIPTVFGANSLQAAEAKANPDLATSDFVGIAVHCAKSSALCSDANKGRPDLLPDEPGGYSGYQGLFGHVYVAPALGGISAIDGTAITGFPGFDGMVANRTLGYVATMQEHGVPVTYAYISDAHAAHTGAATDGPFGPGEAAYVAQLQEYDLAFARFFASLERHGINRKNTVFTFTSDEGDHLIAGPPSPANCDGIHIPCTYAKIGEVSGNLAGLIATETKNTTAFKVHSDSAPTVYITGNPPQTSLITRNLERAAGTVTAINPYTGITETVDNTLADQTQMRLMHMLTADRPRDPTFTMFAKPDYFLFAGGPTCPCISIDKRFNWNHGDIAPEINTTWLGVVGPNVRRLGIDNKVWTDHSDIRPTILALAGLTDDYAHQGRPITEVMSGDVAEELGGGNLRNLAAIYKQINAPVGQLSLDSLRFATKATLSTSAGDQTYLAADARIAGWTDRRDALAGQMIRLLDNTGPSDNNENADDSNARDLIAQARRLLAEVHAAAA